MCYKCIHKCVAAGNLLIPILMNVVSLMIVQSVQ